MIFPLTMKSQEASDTTLIVPTLKFETEIITTKTGKQFEKVYAIYDGKYYDSNKTSKERYNLILRFHGIPTLVLITTGKTRKQKIIVL